MHVKTKVRRSIFGGICPEGSPLLMSHRFAPRLDAPSPALLFPSNLQTRAIGDGFTACTFYFITTIWGAHDEAPEPPAAPPRQTTTRPGLPAGREISGLPAPVTMATYPQSE
ncbi:MAG: hypothetical protein CM15mP74_00120 [Halieaceae bacterium]|nr:MAG: hypothetical protein CM15mP74_00120 [Halieaceae bacterium]